MSTTLPAQHKAFDESKTAPAEKTKILCQIDEATIRFIKILNKILPQQKAFAGGIVPMLITIPAQHKAFDESKTAPAEKTKIHISFNHLPV